jgi:hypothetical protein
VGNTKGSKGGRRKNPALLRPRRNAVVLALEATGVTRRQLARHLDTSEAWVQMVLAGKKPAPRRFQTGVAELVGADPDLLFPGGQAD